MNPALLLAAALSTASPLDSKPEPKPEAKPPPREVQPELARKALATLLREVNAGAVRDLKGQAKGTIAAGANQPVIAPTVWRESCRESAKQVKSTLGPGEGDLVVQGKLAALDLEGPCLSVSIGVSHWNSLVGYLDPTGEKLLLTWYTPEG